MQNPTPKPETKSLNPKLKYHMQILCCFDSRLERGYAFQKSSVAAKLIGAILFSAASRRVVVPAKNRNDHATTPSVRTKNTSSRATTPSVRAKTPVVTPRRL